MCHVLDPVMLQFFSTAVFSRAISLNRTALYKHYAQADVTWLGQTATGQSYQGGCKVKKVHGA